ncbi:aldo/keto reductase [Streptomyces morookaense]|uniref:aldo/keto reductase n=1 Tax=Streptomyces morookaense TaxID=1970 RepID=UPI0019950B24|nr:aldo/keto reductase [Streptomyces morookaense]GHF23690.1 oxidoreductase [Streptomyces morookaense]
MLRGCPRDAFTVSTKVGRLLGAEGDGGAPEFTGAPDRVRIRDYSRDGVLRSLESSLGRLGLDRVDVVYVHDPDEHWEQAVEEAFPALAQLRAEGVVGAIGAGMNQTAMLARFVAETDLDVVLCAGRCSLLEGTAQRELFPLCRREGVAAVAAGVFNSGVLAGPRPGAAYDYAAAPPAVLARARRIAAVCGRYGVPLAAAALAWAGRDEAAACVLVGMRSATEVAEDVRLAAVAVPDALWEQLEGAGLLP